MGSGVDGAVAAADTSVIALLPHPERHSREGGNPRNSPLAPTHVAWIPAFAGMTLPVRLQRQAEKARLRGSVAREGGHALAVYDAAVVHHHGPIPQRLGEPEILLHQQYRGLVALELLEGADHV